MPITETQKKTLEREYLAEWLGNRIDHYKSQGLNAEDVQWKAEQDLLEYAKPVEFEVPDEAMQELIEAEF